MCAILTRYGDLAEAFVFSFMWGTDALITAQYVLVTKITKKRKHLILQNLHMTDLKLGVTLQLSAQCERSSLK